MTGPEPGDFTHIRALRKVMGRRGYALTLRGDALWLADLNVAGLILVHPASFTWRSFGRQLSLIMRADGRSIRIVAREIGIHYSTLHRAMRGKSLELKHYFAIRLWAQKKELIHGNRTLY